MWEIAQGEGQKRHAQAGGAAGVPRHEEAEEEKRLRRATRIKTVKSTKADPRYQGSALMQLILLLKIRVISENSVYELGLNTSDRKSDPSLYPLEVLAGASGLSSGQGEGELRDRLQR
jgi:hypothetical protein